MHAAGAHKSPYIGVTSADMAGLTQLVILKKNSLCMYVVVNNLRRLLKLAKGFSSIFM
jgi:hypothetical protein